MQTTLIIEDVEYLETYKKLGYATKSSLVNEALHKHKTMKKKYKDIEKRRQAMLNTWKPAKNLMD